LGVAVIQEIYVMHNIADRMLLNVALGGLVLASEPKVRGFKAGRGRWTFKGDKNPFNDFRRRGSKAGGSMS
jgi:hypothetical protein